MSNNFFDNSKTEEELRENIIKEIDTNNYKNNLSYQVLLNKFDLTPYIYELEEYDDFFQSYKTKAISSINEKLILHPYQLEILNKLKDEKSIVISAPTSFGKTYSIFEYIKYSQEKKNKILIIVPTIALRNEYIQKINECLERHTIITNSGDIENYENFCLILTHERFVEYFSKSENLNITFDLLVIDEIYKLQNENDKERIYSMSLAYLTAIKHSLQFVFLGPFINNICLPDITNFEVLKYNYSPIATNMIFRENYSYNDIFKVIQINEKTLVYFANKNEINETIKMIQNSDNTYNKELMDYIKNEYDEKWLDEWNILKALKEGVGVHYNEIPNFIKEYVLDAYNDSNSIMTLLATSTLLEGVNTSTKTLIITSDRIGPNRLTDFEFWNLVGRSGRLGKYKVGNVIYFGKEYDFDKKKRFINLDKLWINDELNIDEYQLINDGTLSDDEKQKRLNDIMAKYNLNIDDIKFIFLPFFVKIDIVLDFFENFFLNLFNEVKPLLQDRTNSRKIRDKLFTYVKKYKSPIGIGALPSTHFSVLSEALNMNNKTKSQKIISIVNSGRTNLIKKDGEVLTSTSKDCLNNLYNFSFYMVNNYIPNGYIPGVNIFRLVLEKSNFVSKEEHSMLYNCIFKQVDAYKSLFEDDDIFDTLGIIGPLKIIIMSFLTNGQTISNITDLKKIIRNNKTDIVNKIDNNELYKKYFSILLKKLRI